jgi:hypothetical protein
MNDRWLISLTPGFSRVRERCDLISRFNGLPVTGKPLKRFSLFSAVCTGLKPGVNEIASLFSARLDQK